MSRLHYVFIALVAAIAFFVGITVYKKQNLVSYSELTYVYQPARELNTFELRKDNGAIFTNQDLMGKWSFVFLGYISCPDICPMTMARFSQTIPQLQESTNIPTQVLFLSVDPQRDTQEQLAKYTSYFHQDIIGLHAQHVNLFPFVRNLGLMYSVPDDSETESYFVDHSASVVLVNPLGQIAAIFKPEVKLNQVPVVNMNTLIDDFNTLARLSN